MHHSPPIIALVCWVDLSSLQNNSFVFEIGLEINTNSAPPDMRITSVLPLFHDALRTSALSLYIIRLIPMLIKNDYLAVSGIYNNKHKPQVLNLGFACLENRLVFL